MKRKIHKGDTVKVITGSDKGIIGEVLEVFPAEGKIRVEGVRSQKRHLKPGRSMLHQDGGIVEKLGKIDISNVIFYTEELGGVRVGRSLSGEGRRQREARGKRHSGTVID